MFEEGVDVFGKFVVVIECAIVGFFGVIANMMILINAFDKVCSGSVGLPDLCGVFGVAGDDLIELDDAGMGELEEVVEFAIGAFGVGDILIGVANLFDGEDLVVLFVFDFVDSTVGALAQQAHNLVGFIDVVVDFGLVF